MSEAARAGRGLPKGIGWELALITALAFGVRLVDLGHPPFVDELHHVLAAESLLERGEPAIHDGVPYTRGLLFTYIVAGFFQLFGEGLTVARWPAVLAGTGLVALFFFWLRRVAGRPAAWIGALLLCFAPISLYLSQWARFYTLHALFFWIGAFAIYDLTVRIQERRASRRRSLAVGAVAAISLVLAYHLQVTTIAGLAGILVFTTLVAVAPSLRRLSKEPRAKLWIAAGAAALGVLLAGAGALGLPEWVLERFERVDVWALGRAENPRFYHWLLTDQYGFLWVLFPVAGLVAFIARWRAALFFGSVLLVALLAHSAAAWKAERYVFYAMPALFALWGIAVGELLPRLLALLRERLSSVLPASWPGWIPRLLVLGSVAVALLFAMTGLPAYTYTRQIYLSGDSSWERPPDHLGEWYRGHADWAAVQDRLRQLANQAEVVVAEPDLKAVYYLGDLDFVLYASFVDVPWGPNGEFGNWWKVGRPVVGRPESLARIHECFRSGLVVAERHVWGWSGGVPEPTAEWIAAHAEPVELPESAGLLAYRWTDGGGGEGSACRRLRRTRE